MEFDPDMLASLGWKGVAIALAWNVGKRWLADRELTKKAMQAVRYARNEARRQLREAGVKLDGDALENLAIKHLQRVASRTVRGWDDTMLRGIVVNAYEALREAEAEQRYREGMAFDVENWRKQVDAVPTVEQQLDKAGAVRIEPRPPKE